MNCENIQEPIALHDLLNKDDSRIYNNIKECVYKIYFTPFEKFAHKRILYSYAFNAEDKSDLITYAFAEGQYIFLIKMKEKEFEPGKAILKTYFFEICKFQLLSMIQKRLREEKKAIKMGSEMIEDIPDSPYTDRDIIEEQYKLFEKAMLQIGKKCRRLIEARKLNKEDKAALVIELKIAERSIDNTVCNCTKELKEIIEKMQKQTIQTNGNHYRAI